MDSDAKVMVAFLVFMAVMIALPTVCLIYEKSRRMDTCVGSGESYARCVELVE